jgi:murein DD-endopeptidase MepM/ murein hydrolase activator NlpD
MLKRHLLSMLDEIAQGFAWVVMVPSRKVGVALALLTFLDPSSGSIGLLAAISAWYAGQAAGADRGERPVCVFNGLLIGLFVAHLWMAGVSVMILAVLGGIFAGWLTIALGRLSLSLIKLPILSLPFVIVAMLTSAAGNSFSTLHFTPYSAPPELLGTQIDHFLSAIGNLYFIPNPFVGLFILAVIISFSRYYILLAVTGYSAALLFLKQLGAAPEHMASSAWDSNAILSALLVGGLFATPSLTTAALAVLAAVMAAWLALALGRIIEVAHLVPFSSPFVIAAWCVLYAAVRNNRISSSFNLNSPAAPERSYERTQISLARVGSPSSTPLALPFTGEWTVSQGFSGQHTHRGAWKHALDFIVMESDKSFANKGNRLEDFFCYNQPVFSPAYGQIWRIVNDVPDNPPGTVNVAANWGNFVLIRLYNGQFTLIAHLKPGSIYVLPGAWVKPGDFIGYCGNSGRSPQPHIHLHLQANDEIGAPTIPFHLASVLVAKPAVEAHYQLAVVPDESSTVMSAVAGDVRPFYLFAGRGVRYTVACNEQLSINWCIHCEVDEQGRTVLVSSTGGRCIAESTWSVFACYERDDTSDSNLDLWLLACGYTPVSYQVEHWQDRYTPARLLPRAIAKWMSGLMWPWASSAQSDYQRHWDAAAQSWQQTAHHRQRVTGMTVETCATLAPQIGCIHLTARAGKFHYTMQATSTFQHADIGVPAWESPINISTSPRRII